MFVTACGSDNPWFLLNQSATSLLDIGTMTGGQVLAVGDCTIRVLNSAQPAIPARLLLNASLDMALTHLVKTDSTIRGWSTLNPRLRLLVVVSDLQQVDIVVAPHVQLLVQKTTLNHPMSVDKVASPAAAVADAAAAGLDLQQLWRFSGCPILNCVRIHSLTRNASLALFLHSGGDEVFAVVVRPLRLQAQGDGQPPSLSPLQSLHSLMWIAVRSDAASSSSFARLHLIVDGSNRDIKTSMSMSGDHGYDLMQTSLTDVMPAGMPPSPLLPLAPDSFQCKFVLQAGFASCTPSGQIQLQHSAAQASHPPRPSPLSSGERPMTLYLVGSPGSDTAGLCDMPDVMRVVFVSLGSGSGDGEGAVDQVFICEENSLASLTTPTPSASEPAVSPPLPRCGPTDCDSADVCVLFGSGQKGLAASYRASHGWPTVVGVLHGVDDPPVFDAVSASLRHPDYSAIDASSPMLQGDVTVYAMYDDTLFTPERIDGNPTVVTMNLRQALHRQSMLQPTDSALPGVAFWRMVPPGDMLKPIALPDGASLADSAARAEPAPESSGHQSTPSASGWFPVADAAEFTLSGEERSRFYVDGRMWNAALDDDAEAAETSESAVGAPMRDWSASASMSIASMLSLDSSAPCSVSNPVYNRQYNVTGSDVHPYDIFPGDAMLFTGCGRHSTIQVQGRNKSPSGPWSIHVCLPEHDILYSMCTITVQSLVPGAMTNVTLHLPLSFAGGAQRTLRRPAGGPCGSRMWAILRGRASKWARSPSM